MRQLMEYSALAVSYAALVPSGEYIIPAAPCLRLSESSSHQQYPTLLPFLQCSCAVCGVHHTCSVLHCSSAVRGACKGKGAPRKVAELHLQCGLRLCSASPLETLRGTGLKCNALRRGWHGAAVASARERRSRVFGSNLLPLERAARRHRGVKVTFLARRHRLPLRGLLGVTTESEILRKGTVKHIAQAPTTTINTPLL